MNARPLSSPLAWVLLAAAGLLAADTPVPKSSVPNPLAPRFKQVREKIDTLFQHRNAPPAPIDIRTNPFRMPGSAPVAPATPGEKPVVTDASTDLAILQQSAATLKISGVLEIGGQSHLVINARPYKQGDVFQTQVRGDAVYLRIQDISRRSVTFALNEAEMTLKF